MAGSEIESEVESKMRESSQKLYPTDQIKLGEWAVISALQLIRDNWQTKKAIWRISLLAYTYARQNHGTLIAVKERRYVYHTFWEHFEKDAEQQKWKSEPIWRR